jgi:hypothetical protein
LSSPVSAELAAEEAVARARSSFGRATPKLVILFASVSYEDVDRAQAVVRARFGPVPIVGGTAGACVFGTEACAPRGVSVLLLGGDLEVAVRCAPIRSPDLVEAVPVAEAVAEAADAAAQRGLPYYACLVFAPGLFVDGDALVAAVRKGAGARAQLAGALTGDDLTMDRPKVFAGDQLRSDRVVVTGIFSAKPIGIAARHGWRAVGPVRTVTCADGAVLAELDGRPAAEVWLEDATGAGAAPPPDLKDKDLALYLANHYDLGIVDRAARARHDPGELVVRAPFGVTPSGAVKLSAAVPEGTRVRILGGERDELLTASAEAATAAVERAGSAVVGALVLVCSGRLAALGDAFPQEPEAIGQRIGAPIGGACVFGEIARNVRDSDAFFNTTAVVVAFPA